MGWFDWLRASPAPIIDHPSFGRVRASHRPREGSWLWETLEPVPTPHGRADLTFDAGDGGPGTAHERQWADIVARQDEYTRLAAPLVAAELRDWEDVPFDPARPWDELEWQGAHLSGSSTDKAQFELSYGCKHWPDAMITIYFENGRPTCSQLDD